MARDLNQITIIGNVGADPEMKTWDNGDRQAQFSVCTSESFKNKAGGYDDKPTWHRVIVKAPAANPAKTVDYNNVIKVQRNVSKGTRVLVQGQMVYRQYEQAGVTKYSAEIIVPKWGPGIVEVQPSYKSNDNAPARNDDPPFGGPALADDGIPDFDPDDIPI